MRLGFLICAGVLTLNLLLGSLLFLKFQFSVSLSLLLLKQFVLLLLLRKAFLQKLIKICFLTSLPGGLGVPRKFLKIEPIADVVHLIVPSHLVCKAQAFRRLFEMTKFVDLRWLRLLPVSVPDCGCLHSHALIIRGLDRVNFSDHLCSRGHFLVKLLGAAWRGQDVWFAPGLLLE